MGGPLRYAVRVAGSGALSNVTVKNTYVQADWDIGIGFSDVTEGKIENNNIGGEEEYGIQIVNCSNCNITGNDVSDNQDGICLMNSNSNDISDNVVELNYSGIALFWSSGNTVTRNTAFMNSLGIDLYQSSSNNTISNNSIKDSWQHGLYFEANCTGCSVAQNFICSNNQAGGPYHDIHDADSNSGDKNACDTTHNWNDDGTTGCTSGCGEVEEGPRLCTDPDPPSHDFGDLPEGEERSWSFNITNCGYGGGALTWNISSDQPWITVNRTSGSTTTETDTVTVTVNTTDLESCFTDEGTITINSNGGSKEGTISLHVGPRLCTDPDPPDHDFGDVPKGETRSWSFNISNCGAGTLTWNMTADQTWILTDLMWIPIPAGTNSSTFVGIETDGLEPCNTYNGTITINSNCGTKTGTISVHIPGEEPEAVNLSIKEFGSSSVTLEWEKSTTENFARYEIHKSTEEDFTPSSATVVCNATDINTTQYTVKDLSVDTTYYFKVRVVNECGLSADSNEVSINLCEESLFRLLCLLNCEYAHYSEYKTEANDNLEKPDDCPATVAAANNDSGSVATRDIWMLEPPLSLSFTLENVGCDLNPWYDGSTVVEWPQDWPSTCGTCTGRRVRYQELEINLTDDILKPLEEAGVISWPESYAVEVLLPDWGFETTFNGLYAYAPLECDERAEIASMMELTGTVLFVEIMTDVTGEIYYNPEYDCLRQTAVQDINLGGAVTIKEISLPDFQKDIYIYIPLWDKTVPIGKLDFKAGVEAGLEGKYGLSLENDSPTALKVGGKLTGDGQLAVSFTPDASMIDAYFEETPTVNGSGEFKPCLLDEVIVPFKENVTARSPFVSENYTYTLKNAWQPVLRLKMAKVSVNVTVTAKVKPKEYCYTQEYDWCDDWDECTHKGVPYPCCKKWVKRSTTVCTPSPELNVDFPPHELTLFPGFDEEFGNSEVEANSPIDLIIHDVEGRRAGWHDGEVYEEIPGVVVDPDEEKITVGPLVGPFSIEAIGVEEGTYDLLVSTPLMVHLPDGSVDIAYGSYDLRDISTEPDDEDYFLINPEAFEQSAQEKVSQGLDTFSAIAEAAQEMDSDGDGIPDVEDSEMTYEKKPSSVLLPSLASSAGKQETISAKLAFLGQPLAGASVTFSCDGEEIGSATTNSTGWASIGFPVPGDWAAGKHQIGATFPGNEDYSQSQAKGTLVIRDTPPSIEVLSPEQGANVSGDVPIMVEVEDENLEGVALEIDGVPLQPQEAGSGANTSLSYLWDTTEVLDGGHTIFVGASDTTGLATNVYVSVYVDNLKPPSPPANLVGAGDDSTALLYWDPSMEPDVDGYNVYRSQVSGGGYIKLNDTVVEGNSYQDFGVSNNQPYYYVVTAVDGSGLESEFSSEVEVIPGADGTGPNATISICPGSPVGVSYLNISVQTSEPLPSAPTLGLLLPGEAEPIALSLLGQGDTWITGVNVTASTPSGMATFEFSGTDAADNVGTDIALGDSFEVDTEPPSISNVAVANITSDSATISWDSDQPSDSLAKYGIEPGVYKWQEHDTSLATHHEVTLTGLAAGVQYYFVVSSADEAGNPSESTEDSFATLGTRGDANEDTVVNMSDVTRVERIILMLDTRTPGADANADGMVNMADVTKIERIILGLD